MDLRKKRRKKAAVVLAPVLILLVAGLFLWFTIRRINNANRVYNGPLNLKTLQAPDYVDVDLLKVGNARNGQKLTAINNIVIHYVGNPGTSAKNNRSYFGNPSTEVCSHFLVGLEGEIIQCVPLDEKSAASNNRNGDTISIEVCHPDEEGQFTEASYEALVKLAAWLCDNSGLSADALIRHYDITGKNCPKYYVEHEDAWAALVEDVAGALKTLQADAAAKE